MNNEEINNRKKTIAKSISEHYLKVGDSGGHILMLIDEIEDLARADERAKLYRQIGVKDDITTAQIRKALNGSIKHRLALNWDDYVKAKRQTAEEIFKELDKLEIWTCVDDEPHPLDELKIQYSEYQAIKKRYLI